MSFRIKIMLGIGVIEAILLITLIWNNLTYQRESNEAALAQNARLTAALLTTTVREALLSSDLASLKESVDGLLVHSGIVYARVISRADGVLLQDGDAHALNKPFIRDTGSDTAHDNIFDEMAEIIVAGVPYGRVEIGLSADYIRQTVSVARRQSIMLAIFGMALSGFFSFFLGYLMIRRLNTLTDGVVHIAEGDLGYQIPMKGRDEVARIAEAFNSMSQKLNASYRDLHDALDEARRFEKMKDEFMTIAAHELRTPLTTVQGFSELLLMRKDFNEDRRDTYIRKIHEKSLELSKIINDIMIISLVDSGKEMELNKALTNICEVVKEAVALSRIQWPSGRFELACPPGPVMLAADREKIMRALEHIFSNAVKFSPDGGPITAAGESSGRAFEITVTDTGIGMTAEQAGRIFEKFYRADTSDTAAGGSGIGMTIVKHIAEAHGGQVEIRTDPGEGTTVTISLPFGEDTVQGANI